MGGVGDPHFWSHLGAGLAGFIAGVFGNIVADYLEAVFGRRQKRKSKQGE